MEKSYLSGRQEQEVEEFRKLHREKSFDEARTAVQSQVHLTPHHLTTSHLTPHTSHLIPHT